MSIGPYLDFKRGRTKRVPLLFFFNSQTFREGGLQLQPPPTLAKCLGRVVTLVPVQGYMGLFFDLNEREGILTNGCHLANKNMLREVGGIWDFFFAHWSHHVSFNASICLQNISNFSCFFLFLYYVIILSYKLMNLLEVES